jgi:hypothetical protein
MRSRLSTGIALGEYAESILRQVKSFDQDKVLGLTSQGEREHVGVEPMLLAFGMELALKAWSTFDHDQREPLRSHDLLKLFKALKPESQEKLDQAFRARVAPSNPNFLFEDYGIEVVLHQHANAFVEWRYLHERKDRGISFHTSAFIATLEMVIEEFKKRYHTRKLPHFL